MRSYFACSIAIALLATVGCGDNKPGTDARDGAGDGTGDGIATGDRADLGGSDRADVGADTSGTGGTGGTGGDGGTGGTGGDGGTGGTAGGTDSGVDDGGSDGATPTCSDGIKNSDETGIDCGGHCGKCGPRNPCLVNADCTFACKADKTCADCNLAADCSGPENECEHRSCTAGVCGTTREAAGTVLAVQNTGDCRRRQCGADGTVAVASDDTDVPEDRNPCTNDICTSGNASHTMMPNGSNCGGANTCNANGQCVGCAVATDCPGSDTNCRTRTCTGLGVCGFQFAAAGTPLVDPKVGDCKGMQCDGAGNAQVVNSDTDLEVDGNACTTDECSSGTPSHRPELSGTKCGGSLVCDGASHCVECLSATSCPGTDADCHTRSCVAGECGVSNMATGTLIAAQTPRDCKKTVCDGQGATQTANDDLDLPFDNNPCTQDVCTAGTTSNPFTTAGNSCGTNTICDGQGTCVTCISPSTCPGTDNDCHHRTCINGACGIANTTAGTAVSANNQAVGDCKVVQCDGTGGTMSVTDDADLPVDSKACTDDICTGGVPTNPNLSSGTVCGTNLMCNGNGACVGCVTAANCGTDTFCQARTCDNGTCGVNNTAAGTALPPAMQMDRDCKRIQCDGQGQQQTVNDDTDLPVDGNQCTQDVCNIGIASNPPENANATCNMNNGNRCNGTGTCVQCLQTTDCPGTDTECHHRTCSSAGVCGISNTADGTLTSGQVGGDCKKTVCMGGDPLVVNDDADVFVDGNGCTMDLCSNGNRSNPPLTAGASCNENGGTRCNGSATAPNCVQCLMDSHCGTDNLCKMYHCDAAGQCSLSFVPAGTMVGTQMTGNCQRNVCNGSGSEASAVDNADVPVDGNQCTADVCTGGNPSNPPLAGGVACNMNNGTMCNGSASAPTCVQCLAPTDCGTNTLCKTFTCSSSGMCGSTNTADGTLDTDNPDAAGNCHKNVCLNGATAPAVDDNDLPVDGNLCTDDVCSNGTQSNPPKQVGFVCGPNLMCNGSGGCVGCVMDTDCPTGNACQVRVCNGNLCGFTNVATGTPVPANDPIGDCHKDQCDGNGSIENVVDDTDKLVDNNPCTQDLCNGGVSSNPLLSEGTACSLSGNPLANQCNNSGMCVECLNASTCPGGPDTDCHAVTCVSGACGIAYQPEFTATTMQSAMADCHKVVCDSVGGTRNDIDDTDVPFDPNMCHTVTCMAGNIMTTNSSVGAACAQNGGNRCDAVQACVPTFMVVRLGDGSVALTNVATAVFVEERWETDGTTYRTLALPTSGTSPKPFTLSGTADTSGGLTLSTDGHFVTLAGFNAAANTAGIAATMASAVPRSVAMINAAGVMDTSTTLGTIAFNTDNPRSAITQNGMQFWVAGNGNSTNRGVYYAGSLGATTSTQIESATAATRICQIAFGQLYCDSNTATNGIFTVGSGLPTTTLTAPPPVFATLNGTGAEAGAQFYAFFFKDASTLYIADDRNAPVGGIQKWTLGGSPAIWTKQGTFTTGAAGSPGIRGLAMHDSPAGVVLIGSTASASPVANAIVKFVDSGSFAVAPTTLQAAGGFGNGFAVYRGVAMAPQ